MKGYNGTVFAYGQTGSGKTHTMMGPNINDPSSKGVIPNAIDHIFECIAADTSGAEIQLGVSYMEVYREVIRDLLDPSKVNLQVRDSPLKGIYVEDLTYEHVTCKEDIVELLEMGQKSRATASTAMNSDSSRSHSVFVLTVFQKLPNGTTKAGKLNFIDLAGSEKIAKTGASGDTLEEAKKINQSLSALGMVIKSLADGKPHIPYRDSKLTRLLQDSLGGNTKTTLLVALSPADDNVDETISTLNFAKRAKTIKNVVKVNEQKSAEEMAAMIRVLQRDLDAARRELAIYKGGGVPPPAIAGEDGIVFDSVAYAQLRVEYDDLKSRFDDEVQGIKDENISLQKAREELYERTNGLKEALVAEKQVSEAKAEELRHFQVEFERTRTAYRHQQHELEEKALDVDALRQTIARLQKEKAHLQSQLDDANDRLSDIEATGGPSAAGGGAHKGDSEKVTAVKKQLNDLRAIQREMQAIMNETKDQLTREQTQSAVKDKKLQKCYEMIQELENEKQRLNTECNDLRRNIGDRDATAEQLLNKVMTLQLKLEEKMFAESMMARARQRQKSKIVAPVRSEKKSLWKRVFGQVEGEEGEVDSPESHRGSGMVPTSSAASSGSATSKGSGKGGGSVKARAPVSTLEKQGWSTDGIGGGELSAEQSEFLRKHAATEKSAAKPGSPPQGAGSPGGNGRSLFASGRSPHGRDAQPASQLAEAEEDNGADLEARELREKLELAERQRAETERERLRAEEERQRLESERGNMMQLLKQKTEAVRDLETKASETQDVLSMRNEMHRTELERVQQRLDDAEAMIVELRSEQREREEAQYGSASPRQVAETEIERDRLRAELTSKSAELRQLALAKQELADEVQRLESLLTARQGLSSPPVVAAASEGEGRSPRQMAARIAELEATVAAQTASGTEEKKRLRELVDANTKDLAELSAEWGQRNTLQEARIHELLLQSENAAKDARRLKELLDKRTAKNKELQHELDMALRANGGGDDSVAVPGDDIDGKVRELTARLTETKRQRKAALSKQEATQSALSEAQTRLLELEADNRALVIEVRQAKDNEAEVSKRRDEEVRHLREQVEQLILSFNSSQSQTSSAPPSKSPSPTAHLQEAEPPTPLSAPPPVAASAQYDTREATAAATHVQSVWRGFTDRRKLSDLMEDLGYFDEGGDFSLTSFHYVSHPPGHTASLPLFAGSLSFSPLSSARACVCLTRLVSCACVRVCRPARARTCCHGGVLWTRLRLTGLAQIAGAVVAAGREERGSGQLDAAHTCMYLYTCAPLDRSQQLPLMHHLPLRGPLSS